MAALLGALKVVPKEIDPSKVVPKHLSSESGESDLLARIACPEVKIRQAGESNHVVRFFRELFA